MADFCVYSHLLTNPRVERGFKDEPPLEIGLLAAAAPTLLLIHTALAGSLGRKMASSKILGFDRRKPDGLTLND